MWEWDIGLASLVERCGRWREAKGADLIDEGREGERSVGDWWGGKLGDKLLGISNLPFRY